MRPSKPKRSSAADAREVALNLLARREHSREELCHKLTERGFDGAEIAPLLDRLQAERLQSDVRFTESYIHARHARGFGPVRICVELKQRGVAEFTIDDFLDARNERWYESLRAQYRKRYGDEPADAYNECARRARSLQQRGFSADMIRRLLREMEKHGQ